MAITASTLTSVIVFLPLVVGGKDDVTIFLGEAGFTISVVLLCSLVVSLLMIPLMATWILRRKEAVEPAAVAWLEERYARILAWTFRHKAWTAAIVAAGMAVGFLPFMLKLIETSTFSGSVNRRIGIKYEFADFTYKSDAEKTVSQVEDFLWSRKEEFLVRDLHSFFGENSAFTTIVLAQEDLPDAVLKELRQKIRKAMPPIGGARVYFREEAEEGGSTTYFSVRLFGNDVEGLNQWAEVVARKLQARLAPDRARRLGGLSPQDVADVFAFTLGGLRLPRYNAGEREVEMNVSLALEDRENLADLKQLVVQTPSAYPSSSGTSRTSRWSPAPRPSSARTARSRSR